MRMPKYNAEASLYKRSIYSGHEDEQTGKADVKGIIPAQTLDSSVLNLADPLTYQNKLEHGCINLPKYCYREFYTSDDPFPHYIKVQCGYFQYCW